MMKLISSEGEKIKEQTIDKIYYIRYGNRWSGKYFLKILEFFCCCKIAHNNYSNIFYTHRFNELFMEFSLNSFGGNLYGFTKI